MRPYTPIAAGTHPEMYEASTRDNSLSVNQNLAKMLFGDDKFSIESIAVVHSYNAGLVCRNNNIYKFSNDQRRSVFSYYNTGYSYNVGGDAENTQTSPRNIRISSNSYSIIQRNNQRGDISIL